MRDTVMIPATLEQARWIRDNTTGAIRENARDAIDSYERDERDERRMVLGLPWRRATTGSGNPAISPTGHRDRFIVFQSAAQRDLALTAPDLAKALEQALSQIRSGVRVRDDEVLSEGDDTLIKSGWGR